MRYHGIFLANKININAGKILLVFAGIIFYAEAGIIPTIILGISIICNYLISILIMKYVSVRKIILSVGIISNLSALFFYKYYNFTISIVNDLLNQNIKTHDLFLPLGISFFSFQQIMYLVDIYSGEIEKCNLIDYLSYILYFPKLLMGPLTSPKEFLTQINDPNKKTIDFYNLAAGLKVFSLGLFKKMVIADTISKSVSWGFSNLDAATSGDLFLIMLFYTFEIYFDFSGYSDMAMGISEMLNISLPANFDSPYKSYSIREFWKRWHMSLTGFFTKYIYFPLGGSKKGIFRTYRNIIIVFLISGLWHGANWTFILWGGLHGFLQIIERIFSNQYNKIHKAVQWFYTFLSVNILWLLFRSDSILQWSSMLNKMFSFQNMSVSKELLDTFLLPESRFLLDIFGLNGMNKNIRGFPMLITIMISFLICLVPNSNYKNKHILSVSNMIISAVALVWGLLCLSSESVFIYNSF